MSACVQLCSEAKGHVPRRQKSSLGGRGLFPVSQMGGASQGVKAPLTYRY